MDAFLCYQSSPNTQEAQRHLQLCRQHDALCDIFIRSSSYSNQCVGYTDLTPLKPWSMVMQIQHWLGLPKFETAEQAEDHAAQLVQLFAASQPLVADLDAKERGHADELLVLAAAALTSAANVSATLPSERSTRLLQVRLYVSAFRNSFHVRFCSRHMPNDHITHDMDGPEGSYLFLGGSILISQNIAASWSLNATSLQK